MSIRCAIFDLDGTLVDSLHDIAAAMNDALQINGLPVHPRAAYLHFVGEGVDVLTSRAIAPHTESFQVVLGSYRQAYAARLPGRTQPFAGIVPALDGLATAGLALAVLSNKPDAATQTLVQQLFSPSTFAIIAGQKDQVPRKPDPTAALAIAAQLQVAPGECAFIGDTSTDMDTAVAAGMTAVGVTWGFRSREELRNHGAQLLIDEPSDLLPQLLALRS